MCFGDAFGLYRNEASSICFSQSIAPGSPRPVARAYQLVASIFGNEAFSATRAQRMAQDRVQLMAFERPRTSQRVYVLWNRSFERLVFDLPASSGHAQLYSLNTFREIEAVDGVYRLGLEPATPDDYPYLRPDDQSAVGGPPLIVIEDSPNLSQIPLFLQPPTLTPTETPTPTPTETATPTPS
jgi:hypothetical protein